LKRHRRIPLEKRQHFSSSREYLAYLKKDVNIGIMIYGTRYSTAILMPKAAICELSIIYPIKTILAMLALQQRPAALRPNRISHPIFGHSGSQCAVKICHNFTRRSFFINSKTGWHRPNLFN
jgi:hypothetical protein